MGRALAAFAAALTIAGTAAPARAETAFRDGHGLEVVSVKRLSGRLVDITVRTDALDEPAGVRVLLPKGYEKTTRRYPVLYLLHGGVGSHVDWTEQGDAERITADVPLIVVMPDGGGNGNYTDWYNFGAGGPPRWETFHINQLIPWVDDNLRTVRKRTGRGLAGLSMGGGGTMQYASRHPDMFVSAASFSGAVDTNYPPVQVLIEASPTFSGTPTRSVYGPRATEEVRWRGHNPWDLAGNLRGLALALYAGNGQPREGQCCAPLDPVEYGTYEMSRSLHRRLQDLGIDHRWVEGLGQHQWGDWQRYLRAWLPAMMDVFADPPPRPSRIAYTAVEPSYGVYGWRVSLRRAAPEFSLLSAGSGWFSVTGSGAAVVRTPPRYEPGSSHAVWVAPEGDRCVRRRVTADDGGRLTVSLPLGPPNPDQQFTAAARLSGTRMFTSTAYVDVPGWRCR